MFTGKDVDLEYGEGGGALYPMMHESPVLRWAFIRKIYSILTVQLLMTVAVAATMVTVKPISVFFATTSLGFGLYIFFVISPFIVICLLQCYSKKHPVNYILLGIFTLAMSFAVGMSCAFTNAQVVLQAAILTAAVTIGLTLFTFWAAKKGYDFSFLGIFLGCALLVLIVAGFIQIFFPMGKVSTMLFAGLGTLIFSGFIIYDTDNLIKRFSYDEYILAAATLYLDIINLFLQLLSLLRASES